jgi:indoleamine 2,3-dioxygenase
VEASIDADAPATAAALETIAGGMAPVLAALERVREWCDPHTYYLRVRPFFAGWPDPGVVYEGVDPEPVKYIGGSAGQSSIVQVLDAALGVRHARPETGAYLCALRRYMPVGHRRLVEEADRLSRVRAMAAEGPAELRDAYNAAVEQLDLFRRRHIGLAHDFIARPSGMADATGTGGTSFVDFLREARIGAARSKL